MVYDVTSCLVLCSLQGCMMSLPIPSHVPPRRSVPPEGDLPPSVNRITDRKETSIFIIKSITASVVDVTYRNHSNTRCDAGDRLHQMTPDSSGYYDNCKEWCVTTTSVVDSPLVMDDATCGGELFSISGFTTFLKNNN